MLKGYLFYKNRSPSKTHDLVKLVEACLHFDQEFKTILADAVDLNPHVSTSRYPDSCLFFSDLTAAQALVQKAAHIFHFVTGKIDC